MTGYAFAALKSDGSIFAWGDSRYGGDTTTVASQLTSGVSSLHSNRFAFSVLKTDGSVVAWGDSNRGGDVGAADVSSGVVAVHSTLLNMHEHGAMYAVKAVSR